MKRFVLGFLCAMTLAIAPACGGDDDDTGDTGDTAGADADTGNAAEAFCTDFAETCGFTDWYTDMAGCVAAFNGFDTDRQACVVEHLGFAAGEDEGSADREMHCGHAGGEAPCD